jgi:hypothetical protein
VACDRLGSKRGFVTHIIVLITAFENESEWRANLSAALHPDLSRCGSIAHKLDRGDNEFRTFC